MALLCRIGLAQDFDGAQLDRYFDALAANDKFMGSVAVSRGGEVVYTRAVGFSDVADGTPADENSKYRIGSISKTFTTVLVLKAVENKKLKLDQTIDKYFPTIPNAEQITIRHLLHHRSGIHNFTDDADYLTWNTQPKTEPEMVAIIASAGSDFEPDSQAQYSNSNFVLLTYILQRRFKQPYAELLRAHITQPLGLEHTYMGGKINTADGECQSYSYLGTWNLESETDASVPLGAGGIVSTPSDLVKFSDALFGGKLLRAESLNRMKNIRDEYGMGLLQVPFYDRKGYGHTGGIDGFTSVFLHFPNGNVSYALTSNGTNYNNNNISIAVLSTVYGKPFDIPAFSTYEVSSADVDTYLGTYSSIQIPLKITITEERGTLIAQATGQPAFPLEATAKDKFKFEQAGVILEFDPAQHTMLLKQGGMQYDFVKE